jgi:phosphoglucosamine mutase
MLEAALTAGLCSAGVDVLRLGMIPSGGVAYLTRRLQAVAGVMVSASHNLYADNGIKFFSPSGAKIETALENEIEARLQDSSDTFPRPTGRAVGCSQTCLSAARHYADFLKSTFRGTCPIQLRVGLDCANGAASHIAPALFEKLGARVWALYASPDGVNINRQCGSLHPEALRRQVLAQKLDVGFAFDGDADRLTVVDHTGQVLDGDNILAICAETLLEADRLPRTVVSTVMANWGLRQALQRLDCALHTVQVGDKHVVHGMRQTGAVLGGEPSGHVIFSEHLETSDGLLTALQLLHAMQRGQTTMADLARNFRRSPQVLTNVRLSRRCDPHSYSSVRLAIDRAERTLGDPGRVLVRLSGTEPVARVLLEGPEVSTLTPLAGDICRAIEAELGTPENPFADG